MSTPLQRFIDAEFDNYDAMVRDAIGSHESVPLPTVGSARDSLAQMPDDILEAITNANANEMRAEFEAEFAGAPDDFLL